MALEIGPRGCHSDGEMGSNRLSFCGSPALDSDGRRPERRGIRGCERSGSGGGESQKISASPGGHGATLAMICGLCSLGIAQASPRLPREFPALKSPPSQMERETDLDSECPDSPGRPHPAALAADNPSLPRRPKPRRTTRWTVMLSCFIGGAQTPGCAARGLRKTEL